MLQAKLYKFDISLALKTIKIRVGHDASILQVGPYSSCFDSIVWNEAIAGASNCCFMRFQNKPCLLSEQALFVTQRSLVRSANKASFETEGTVLL